MPRPRAQFGPPTSNAAPATAHVGSSDGLKAQVIADIARVAAKLDRMEGLRYDQYRAHGDYPSHMITELGGWDLLSEAARISPPSPAAIQQSARHLSARPQITYSRKPPTKNTKRIRDPFDKVIGFAVGQNHCHNVTASAA